MHIVHLKYYPVLQNKCIQKHMVLVSLMGKVLCFLNHYFQYVMNVTCPNCSSSFEVDLPELDETGVSLECAECQHVFEVKKEIIIPQNFLITLKVWGFPNLSVPGLIPY